MARRQKQTRAGATTHTHRCFLFCGQALSLCERNYTAHPRSSRRSRDEVVFGRRNVAKLISQVVRWRAPPLLVGSWRGLIGPDWLRAHRRVWRTQPPQSTKPSQAVPGQDPCPSHLASALPPGPASIANVIMVRILQSPSDSLASLPDRSPSRNLGRARPQRGPPKKRRELHVCSVLLPPFSLERR